MRRFIEKYLLCTKCKYPETTMFIKQKKLMSKCRACGTENQLDDTHRAGTQLMKNLPKDMSEIDSKKTEDKKTEETKEGGKAEEDGSGDEDDKKDKKKKKKATTVEEEEEQPPEEEGIKLDSEEIGK